MRRCWSGVEKPQCSMRWRRSGAGWAGGARAGAAARRAGAAPGRLQAPVLVRGREAAMLDAVAPVRVGMRGERPLVGRDELLDRGVPEGGGGGRGGAGGRGGGAGGGG